MTLRPLQDSCKILFKIASGSGGNRDIRSFIEKVRSYLRKESWADRPKSKLVC